MIVSVYTFMRLIVNTVNNVIAMSRDVASLKVIGEGGERRILRICRRELA